MGGNEITGPQGALVCSRGVIVRRASRGSFRYEYTEIHGVSIGVHDLSTANTVRFERNRVFDNNYGIWIQTSSADLGSPGGSVGGNHIYCNGSVDLHFFASIPITAQNNLFDHNPP